MTAKWLEVVAAVVAIAATASCSTEHDPGHDVAPPALATDAGPAVDSDSDPDSERGEAGPDAAAPAAPPALGSCAGPAGKRVRTLIVGNSQIYFWDLPKLLSDISTSAPLPCPRVDAEGFTRGGQNLKRLWTEGDSTGQELATVIRSGSYDVVVIAESIDLVEPFKPVEEFTTYANAIIDAARASGARPMLYATPYPSQPEHRGFVEMATPQLALGRARSVTVAAGGLAWLRVWQVLPAIDLHHPDRGHPGYKGSYVSALVLYSAITGATPIGLTRSPPLECMRGSCPPTKDPITAEEAAVFQSAAWAEVRATALE